MVCMSFLRSQKCFLFIFEQYSAHYWPEIGRYVANTAQNLTIQISKICDFLAFWSKFWFFLSKLNFDPKLINNQLMWFVWVFVGIKDDFCSFLNDIQPNFNQFLPKTHNWILKKKSPYLLQNAKNSIFYKYQLTVSARNRPKIRKKLFKNEQKSSFGDKETHTNNFKWLQIDSGPKLSFEKKRPQICSKMLKILYF